MTAYLTRGIKFPPVPQVGHNDTDLLNRWRDIVEELMTRGLEKPADLQRLTGLAYTTCARYVEQIREKWSATMAAEEQQWRRERLYYEAERVAREGWDNALAADNPTAKAAFLKVVLAANQRKASLCGLDKVEIRLDAKIETAATLDVVSHVEQEFQLAPGALKMLGKEAALMFSKPPVLEGEVVPE
jgi:hypothetical protein